MKRLTFIMNLVFASAVLSAAASAGYSYTQSDLDELIALNNAETRLSEFKDNSTTLKLKLEVLDLINTNRARHGLKPLKLDILAGRVASKASSEAAKGGYRGHWNLRGEKPYHRFAFAGGVDHVAENASMVWSSAAMTKNFSEVLKFIKESHMRMYNETPPNDGHRKNILDPWHTHVGLGFSMINNNFRYYELYVDRYLDFEKIDREVAAGTEARIAGKVTAPGFGVYMVVVFYEPFPSPMTAMEVNSHGSYPDFTRERSEIMNFAALPSLNADGKFSFSVKTRKPGLYYVQVYIRQGKPENWNFISTAGLPSVSGVVIRAK